MTLTDPLLSTVREVVSQAYLEGIAVQSNTARSCAAEVACAASLGFITTKLPDGFGRRWRVTPKGLRWIEQGASP